VAERILSLPIYCDLGLDQVERICEIIRHIQEGKGVVGLSNSRYIMKTSFYKEEEFRKIGIKKYGRNVLISRKASIYSPERLVIGDNVRIDDFCILSGDIQVGSYVHIAPFCGLFSQEEKISIGDFASLSARVSIYTFSDDYVFGSSLVNPTVPDQYKRKIDKGPVILEKHTIVGVGSVILPSTTIKEGAVIGALSLVRGSIDSWGIYRGNPAELIGKRRNADILELEKKLLKETVARHIKID
jgi:galactoside O-acetyltransferase